MLTVSYFIAGLVGLVVILFTVFFNFENPKHLRQKIEIGRPKGLPVIGNVLDFLPDVFMESVEKYSKLYGSIVEVYLFGKRIYLISDVKVNKEILHLRPKHFRRLWAFDYAAKVLKFRTGLFHSHGHVWSRIRKLTSPALTKHRLIRKSEDFFLEGQKFVDSLTPLADGKTVVNMKLEIFRFTMTFICQAAFGLELTGDFKEYFLGKQFPEDINTTFKFLIESATFPLPFWVWRNIPWLFRIEVEAREADGRMSILMKRIIAHKRAELKANPQCDNKESVIDILIRNEKVVSAESSAEDAAVETTSVRGEVEGEGLITDDEILANVKTFFSAGSDTTGVTICWCLYFLSLDAQILSEVQQEVDAFYQIRFRQNYDQTTPPVDLYTLLSSEKMPLTNAVIKETLRLYSPAPVLFMQTESKTEPYTLSNGLTLQPKDEVFMHIDAIHWNEQVFGDPKSFLPSRWLTKDITVLSAMESNYLAWGAGPRVCPGMNIAQFEAMIALVSIVHAFDFKLACDKTEIKRILNFTAQPTKMPMILTKRSRPVVV